MNNTDTGERLATMETELKNVVEKSNGIENSVQSLHGKLDQFMLNISTNYVASATFEQYKKTQEQKDRNRILEKIMWSLVTAVIVGLISFFLREIKF